MPFIETSLKSNENTGGNFPTYSTGEIEGGPNVHYEKHCIRHEDAHRKN